jgi:hypothetical protein
MNENYMQPKISFSDIQLKASYMSLTWECVSEGMKKENSTERNNKNEGWGYKGKGYHVQLDKAKKKQKNDKEKKMMYEIDFMHLWKRWRSLYKF